MNKKLHQPNILLPNLYLKNIHFKNELVIPKLQSTIDISKIVPKNYSNTLGMIANLNLGISPAIIKKNELEKMFGIVNHANIMNNLGISNSSTVGLVNNINSDFRTSISKIITDSNNLNRINMSKTIGLNPVFKQTNYFNGITNNLKPFTNNLTSVFNNNSMQSTIEIVKKNQARHNEIKRNLLHLTTLMQKLEHYYPNIDIDEISLEEAESLVENYEYTTEFLALDKLQLTIFSTLNEAKEISNSISARVTQVHNIIDYKISRKNRYLFYNVCNTLISFQVENGINAYFDSSIASLMLNIYYIFLLHLFKISSPNNKKDTDD